MTPEQADAHQRKHGFPPLKQQGKTLMEVFGFAEQAKLRISKRKMNRSEREYAAGLEVMKQSGKIADYKFEGVRLLYADGLRYTPDFAVLQPDFDILLIEVKGRHVPATFRQHAIQRFLACRAEWSQWYGFEFWQKNKHNEQWSRLFP